MSIQDNISILLDAKREYNKHLVSVFKTNIINTIKKLYGQSEELCVQENTPENILMVFQDYLSKIARWTDNKIASEFGTLKQKSGCDWLEDLIKMIYITNIKIMTLINKIKPGAQIRIKVPAGGQFYHLCMLEVARQIWKKPYLFAKQVGTANYKNNMLEVDRLVGDCIIEVIRVQMPVKSLVQEFIDTDNSLVLTAEHDVVSSNIDPANPDNIKALVNAGLPEPVPEPIIPVPEPIIPVPEPIIPVPEPIIPVPEPIIPVPEPVPTIQESFINNIKSREKTATSISKHKKHSHSHKYKQHTPANTKQSKITELLSKPGTDNPDRLTKDPLTDLINVDDIEEFDLPKSKHVIVTEPELVEDTESIPVDTGVKEPESIPAGAEVKEPESIPVDTGVTEPESIPVDTGVKAEVKEPESIPVDTGVKEPESIPVDTGVKEPESIPADTGVKAEVKEPESIPVDAGVTEPESIPASGIPLKLNSKPTPSGREFNVTSVPLHWAYNPVHTVQSNQYSASSTLSALLNPDELADLDIDLEELSMDNILEEKKAIKPITVKKPAPFMFFKNAPKFPG